jgi:hypothetical protein
MDGLTDTAAADLARAEELARQALATSWRSPPPSDFCLHNIGLYELGIDPGDVLPPMKPA